MRPYGAPAHRFSDLGEVSGRVEVMNGHRGNWFALYEPIHGRRVRCNIPVHLVSDMDAAWRRLVTVTGMVTRDATGLPISISDVQQIIVHDDPEPGAWRRSAGVAPAAPGAPLPEDTIRGMRA